MAMMDPKMNRHPVEPGKIEIEAVSMATIINAEEKDKLIANNSTSVKSLEVMSPELDEGMIIQAQDGGNPNKAHDDIEMGD